MTTILNETFSRLSPGRPQIFDGLTVVPLQWNGPSPHTPPLALLDQALSKGEARISEVSEAGVVSTIRVENLGKKPLLILDGEELVGAKQNRITNLSILAAAESVLEIPVSCVEAGRWAHRSRHFSSSGYMQFSKGRARKAEAVGLNMKLAGSRCSDQGQVWDDVEEVLGSLHVPSPSRSMNDSYLSLSGDLNAYTDALVLPGCTTGAAVLHGNRVLGLELFASPALFGETWPKILKSYALEAIVAKRRDGPTGNHGEGDAAALAQLQDFTAALTNSPVDCHRAIGLGEDIRFEADLVVGAALGLRGQLVHLCAFSRHIEKPDVHGRSV